MSERPETRPEALPPILPSGASQTGPANGLPEPTPLQRAQARQRELREAGVQPERLDPIERAKRKPTSLRLAITAKCYECGGRDADPNWRARIAECVIPTCSLYPVRPFQRGAEAEKAAQ